MVADLRKKSKVLEAAPEDFFKEVTHGERIIWGKIKAKLARLDTERGKVTNSPGNMAQLYSLDTDLVPDIVNGLKTRLNPYLANFEEIERLNRLVYEGLLSEEQAARLSRVAFTTERTFIIDEVTKALTEPAVIRQQIVSPIRQLLYKGVVFGEPISKLQANLRAEILSKDGNNSRMLRYTRQIAQDAISQFDGAINDKIRDEIEADGFAFIGSLIKTSRANCRELVTGTGKFADLAVEPGIYAVSDLPEIVNRMQGRSGFNANTTAQTFGQYRGGYGCRHEILYFPLDEEQVRNRVKKVA